MQFLVNLDVDNLEKAVQFYSAAFGLHRGRRLDNSCIEMLGGPAPIYLLEKAAGTAACNVTESRRYTRHWTPLHLDLIVEVIEPAVQKAVAAGAVLEEPISSHAWGKLALMADPFGHGFCFVQFSEQGYDAITAYTEK
ncbi:MAG TPA: VOC family protein [Oxalicibacterium sp.]|uniref:VOC family protein n=1 Tax=Oxalicibacterium sp. TaxID=2766525 RepID=UPI002C84EB2E|nr:VOC family protein [Oxalicibacterium sp.]HWU98815.1 VOC family protein [Oxalicibacterium sp.]